ncbi:MAG: HD domain-containing phosphohydrolase [Candidatus Sedimenticola sp. 6PFRAG5]
MPLAAPGSLDIGRRIRTFWYGCRTYPIALLILLCGTGISLLAGNWYEREEYLRLEQEFLRTTESQLHNIEHTLQHNGEVIKQLGLIYELSLEFSPSSFQHYLRGLSDFEHRFKAVEWIPRVTHEQRASFELEAQAFYPGYRITERMEQGAMVAAKPRPEYFPVYLVEPLAGNEAALGFDLASQATRKRALQKSAESGEFSVSGRITLVQETGAQYGVLAFYPVHRHSVGAPATDKDLLGFTLGVFRLGDLLHHAVDDPVSKGVNILLEDLSAPGDERFLHYHSDDLFPATGAGESVSGGDDGSLRIRYQIDFGGRLWQVTFTSAEGFFQIDQFGIYIRIAGSLVSLLLASYLLSMILRDRHISILLVEREAQQKEMQSTLVDLESQRLEIEQSRKEWTASFDAVTDPIFVHDDQFRIVRVNKAYSSIAEKPIDELLGKPYFEIFPRMERPLNSCLDMMASGKEGALEEDESFEQNNRTYISHAYLIPGETGVSLLGVHIIRDVTEDIRLEELRQEYARSIKQSLVDTIYSVSLTVEKRDPYTAGHQQRVAKLAVEISRGMDMDETFQEGLYFGGLIHDIGKIYIPSEILNRPGRLNDLEFSIIKTHPQVGWEILKEVTFPWPVKQMIRQHHERIDGSGYPDGIQGDEICIEARILAVADVLEAMASHRPYRPALPLESALEEIEANRGTLYDERVVDACMKLFRDKGFRMSDLESTT